MLRSALISNQSVYLPHAWLLFLAMQLHDGWMGRMDISRVSGVLKLSLDLKRMNGKRERVSQQGSIDFSLSLSSTKMFNNTSSTSVRVSGKWRGIGGSRYWHTTFFFLFFHGRASVALFTDKVRFTLQSGRGKIKSPFYEDAKGRKNCSTGIWFGYTELISNDFHDLGPWPTCLTFIPPCFFFFLENSFYSAIYSIHLAQSSFSNNRS